MVTVFRNSKVKFSNLVFRYFKYGLKNHLSFADGNVFVIVFVHVGYLHVGYLHVATIDCEIVVDLCDFRFFAHKF